MAEAEERLARPRRLDRGPERLQAAQRVLPDRLGADRVRRHQLERGTRESASAKSHSRSHAKYLRRSGCLADDLRATWDWRQGHRPASSPSRSSSALVSESRGMRAQAISIEERTYVRIGWRGCQAGFTQAILSR